MSTACPCPPPEQVYEEPECQCSHHTMIVQPGNENTPCKWDEALPPIITDPRTPIVEPPIVISSAYMSIEFKVLFEEDGWFIEAHPDVDEGLKTSQESWVAHYCPSVHWKVYIDPAFMTTYGVCDECYEHIPPGIIALWKMHNWDDIQQSGPAPAPTSILGPEGLSAAYAHMAAWESCETTRRPAGAPETWKVPKDKYIWRGIC